MKREVWISLKQPLLRPVGYIDNLSSSLINIKGVFHLSRLNGNVAGKLVNAYLRYQNRQPATRFPLTTTVAMLAIPVLPVTWKAPLDNVN